MRIYIKIIAILLIWNNLHAQVPLNWTVDEINPGEDVTLYPDGSFLTEGLRSCHLRLNSGSVPYLVSEVYYVTPGEAYEFSFDVFDNDTAGQIKVYADFYDTYGFDIFGQPPVFSVDSSEWITVRWEGVIPPQAVVGYVLIKFYNQPDLYNFTKTANIWIDDIRFRQTGGDNLVANGGFEDWAVGIDENRNDESKLLIFPNPASNFVNIDLPDAVKFIVISDMIGKEVMRAVIDGERHFQIDIQKLTKGAYLTTAIFENGLVISNMLLKI